MRILILHSDLPPDAPPDDLDTLETATALSQTLTEMGHTASLRPFALSRAQTDAAIREAGAELVFNMVESVFEQDGLAAMAPSIFEGLGVPFTGNGYAQIALTGDKPMSKRLLRRAGLPTPDWSEPPLWDGIEPARSYIVKSATEDASLGLDDGSVVQGRDAVAARARECESRFGGRWFAESYVDGAEYNVAMVERGGLMTVLSLPEMCFEDWPDGKPRIVGYRAKWDPDSIESDQTVRRFGLKTRDPALAQRLSALALDAASLFGMRGYARVDFRVDRQGRPMILEINPNPSLDPVAGFAAAAKDAGLSYQELIALILEAAIRR